MIIRVLRVSMGYILLALTLFFSFSVFAPTFGMSSDQILKGKTVLLVVSVVFGFICYLLLRTDERDLQKDRQMFIFFSASEQDGLKAYRLRSAVPLLVGANILFSIGLTLWFFFWVAALMVSSWLILVSVIIPALAIRRFMKILRKHYGSENLQISGSYFSLKNPLTIQVVSAVPTSA